MNNTVSVIISFYNKIDVLKLVLSGFERQSYKDFEIIIADDGSSRSTVDELKVFISSSSLIIRHVWHEDSGWRKNTILNTAIAESGTDYLVFIDGDCIPHRHFVKEHFKARELNFVLTGRRVLLSRRISESLNPHKVRRGFLEHLFLPWMLVERILGKGEFIENAVYFRNGWIRKKINKKDRGLLGSNFSLHKSDMMRVNGFDERYQAPYIGEDTDLDYRLRLLGCRFRHLKHLAVQYHYYHPRLPFTDTNNALFEDNKLRNQAFTPFGIIKTISTV